MRVTIKDIAQELGISTTAVSLALNGKYSGSYLSETTRRRIQEKAAELGYTPNHIARALATGRTNAVRFLALHPERPFYSKAFHSLRTQADEDDYTISYASHLLAEASQVFADGIIAMDCPKHARSIPERNHTPIVSIGAFYADDGDYVGVDLRPGVLEAMQHLIDSGRKRIAYLVYKDERNLIAGEPRYDGYLASVIAAGLQPEYINTPMMSRRAAREAIDEYVRSRGCPDALLCLNDDLAIGAFKALSDLGISMPDDIALVGCDGIEDCEYHNPAISTIVQPVEEMCALAWQYLQNRIHDPSIPFQQKILDAGLVIRGSSDN